MFGNLGEMANLMKSAMKIQENLKKVKEEMSSTEVNASSSGDYVRVTLGGDFTLRKIEISPELAKGDNMSLLEGMVAEAMNSGIEEVKRKAQENLNKATGGLNIPGLF